MADVSIENSVQFDESVLRSLLNDDPLHNTSYELNQNKQYSGSL